MHNFVFQGGGVGGVGGLFSGILRCEFNRFEFNKFPPPPNKATHGQWNWQQLELFVIVYQMLLAAVFVILKLFQNNLPSVASTWQVVVWQRLVVSCMVMWWCGTRTRCLTAPSPNRLSSSVFKNLPVKSLSIKVLWLGSLSFKQNIKMIIKSGKWNH